jgi:hypothetical protein
VAKNSKGILIFVFDAAVFEAGQEGFNIIYNIGLLSSAVIAFSLFPEKYEYQTPIKQHKVDWTAWQMLSQRCCVVMRRPTVVNEEGTLLKGVGFDEFVSKLSAPVKFEKLGDLKGFVRFESTHVLPKVYPVAFSEREDIAGKELYWDVLIRHSCREPEGLSVNYYIPPPQSITNTLDTQIYDISSYKKSGYLGKNIANTMNKSMRVEEDIMYVIKRETPGVLYDDAQKAIYMAARGRLSLDSGVRHIENLNAASALRQIGYEVLPISIMLLLFPKSLHLAAISSE